MDNQNTVSAAKSDKVKLILAWLLVLLTAAILIADYYHNVDQSKNAQSACSNLVDKLQADKERYAREHGLKREDRLTAGQLKEITTLSKCQTDDDGHCLCQGGWAIELNPVVGVPARLVPATLDESDPCEKMITTVHVAVKDYARSHGIPFEATLTVEQIQSITDSLSLPRDEKGQFVCPEGQTFAIQPVVIHRPRQNMEIKILMPKPD